MNSNRGHIRLYLAGCLVGLSVAGLFFIAMVWAASDGRPDYQGYDLENQYFDGKPWDWYLDMFNAPSIKPQEEGTFQRFPTESVPRTGVEPEVPNTANDKGLLRDQIPPNPTRPTAASIANGRKMYNIYCTACHGADGMSQTPIVKKGMPAPPIKALVAVFSEAHLYNKIRYGGPLMPTYGFQTMRSERWDMVNYMKSQQFGK